MWRPRSGFFFFFPGSGKQQQQLYELTYFDSTAIYLRTRRRSQEILITNARSVLHFFCKEQGINLSVIVLLSSFYCKGSKWSMVCLIIWQRYIDHRHRDILHKIDFAISIIVGCPKCVQLISCPVPNWCLRYCWKDTVDQGREKAIEDKMQGKMQPKWSSIKRKQLLWNLHLEWNSWSHFLNVGISIKPRVILLISTQSTATIGNPIAAVCVCCCLVVTINMFFCISHILLCLCRHIGISSDTLYFYYESVCSDDDSRSAYQ